MRQDVTRAIQNRTSTIGINPRHDIRQDDMAEMELILNVDSFSKVRRAHVCDKQGYHDGMHYCSPGVLDVIPHLLLTLSQRLETRIN
jgi:hypothetical protein